MYLCFAACPLLPSCLIKPFFSFGFAVLSVVIVRPQWGVAAVVFAKRLLRLLGDEMVTCQA